MSVDKDRLKDDVISRLAVLFADHENPPSADTVWTEIADAILTEIVQNLAIIGVQVAIGPVVTGILTAGVPVPMDGGTGLKTTMIAAAIGEQPVPQIAVQTGDGTGLIS